MMSELLKFYVQWFFSILNYQVTEGAKGCSNEF